MTISAALDTRPQTSVIHPHFIFMHREKHLKVLKTNRIRNANLVYMYV